VFGGVVFRRHGQGRGFLKSTVEIESQAPARCHAQFGALRASAGRADTPGHHQIGVHLK